MGIVIAGPVAAGLAGAGAGGITGGIVGALVGAGIPKERATKYEQGIKEGEIVLAVDVHNEEDARYFEEEWQNYGHNIYRLSKFNTCLQTKGRHNLKDISSSLFRHRLDGF